MSKTIKNIYAKELKTVFDVFGHFYDLEISGTVFKCRSLLDIKRKDLNDDIIIPDIAVIMMNPGSSKPLDQNYIPKTYSLQSYGRIKKKEIIPARPDNAQYQIMRLMLFNNWNFVRVLNLSDLRNGNSGDFQIDFLNAGKLNKSNPHCITHKVRKKELLNSIRSESNKIIAAWGSIDVLKESAESILKQKPEIIGIINGSLPNFRYASPLMQKKKEEWLKEIQRLIFH